MHFYLVFCLPSLDIFLHLLYSNRYLNIFIFEYYCLTYLSYRSSVIFVANVSYLICKSLDGKTLFELLTNVF